MKLIRKLFATWLSKIILKNINENVKQSYRKLENVSLKLISTNAHRCFNETCINNNLLPKYTNIKVHDDVTTAEPFVADFRRNLIVQQISKQSEHINAYSSECDELKDYIKCKLACDIKFEALMIFMQRITDSRKMRLHITQSNKLARLNGADIFLKQQRESVLNLSNVKIDESMKRILNLGMNCHLRTKYNTTRKKIEIEKLFSQIE
jgi:hypothetical protein